MSSPVLPVTGRTTFNRLPKRGTHERATIEGILDEALFCHIGFVHDGQPFVLPTIHARVGAEIYVHGSAAGRMLRTLAGGTCLCLTATLLDGLVLARSAFHHSMNYRSVVVLGKAQLVSGDEERSLALRAIVEHVAPGRWDEVRWPNANEMKATHVLKLPLAEASAKVRTGGPLDDEEDYGLATWAGVVPLGLVAREPLADPRLSSGTAMSPAVLAAARRGR